MSAAEIVLVCGKKKVQQVYVAELARRVMHLNTR